MSDGSMIPLNERAAAECRRTIKRLERLETELYEKLNDHESREACARIYKRATGGRTLPGGPSMSDRQIDHPEALQVALDILGELQELAYVQDDDYVWELRDWLQCRLTELAEKKGAAE